MVFLISIFIATYIATGNPGTKAVKIIVVLSISTGEKVSICKAFHRHRLFDNTKSNTIFYLLNYIPFRSLASYALKLRRQ